MNSWDDAALVRGEALFVDDRPEPAGTLHAAVFGSPVAHGTIRDLEVDAAMAAPGVAAVFTAAAIPGENQVGVIIPDEPLLAPGRVDYVGQPVAVVVARSPLQARQARAAIRIAIDPRPAVFDPRQAAAAGSLIAPARTIAAGDVDAAWRRCHAIVAGQVDSGGQEHLYLETQSALAVPEPGGRLHLHVASQSPSSVQRAVARILSCPMHAISVTVPRLGGAFGGKEDQATPWAAMAALAAMKLRRPVKLVLGRDEDMRMTGKRHPYSSDYRLGLDADGRFLAFEVTYYQNAGASADLSTAVLERTLFHATGSYAIPNVRISGMCCRTHLPPFTAFRGFGAPQAVFVIEAAIAAAAETLGVPALGLQQANLLRHGDGFPYGMAMQGQACRRSFATAVARFDVHARLADIARHNADSPIRKRGLAVMPVCFGIAFTTSMLNQAGALVHVYVDGSVGVSTGAVEMGQGVTAKLRRIAAEALGIGLPRVRVAPTSTSRVANVAPTAASTGTDLNGAAVLIACRMILERLKAVAAQEWETAPEAITILDERVRGGAAGHERHWTDLVQAAVRRRVDLSAHAHYATPDLHYDRVRERGRPFAYHVCGTAVVEAELDALRGTAAILSVQVVHDAGRCLDPLVDQGQVEGGVVQGIGWMTMEELVHDAQGRLLTDALATYKVPDLHAAPAIEIVYCEDPDAPRAVMQSKAIGEPPFLYGIGAWLAIRAALRAVRPLPTDRMTAPLTAERILTLLEGSGAARRCEAPASASPSVPSAP